MTEKTYYLKTFGCQANLADSEKIGNYLCSAGLSPVDDIKKAAWIIINSCAVRQSAENRVYGLANNLQKFKIKNLKLKIILTGCMLYHPIEYLKKRLPGVDYFVKTPDWPEFIKAHFDTSQYRSENIVPVTEYKGYALVPIMEGCDNFCAYCVVPYARGREQSRPMEEIIDEVKDLVKKDYRKVLLLGQNVNSYGKNLKRKTQSVKQRKISFAMLLRELNKIKGLRKIAFLSSNPWDLTDDIIEAMALPKVSRYFHLPVQSGDKEILHRMNRKYTPLQYIELVKKIRDRIPDIKISTDIIVGFPDETKEQFQHTVDLCREIGFYQAFISKYSPRPGTAAYKMEDNVPIIEKKRRWRILDNLINRGKVKI